MNVIAYGFLHLVYRVNEIRSDIRNAHRMVSHYEHNSLVDVNARLDEFQRVGREKMVRKERIVYLRGGRCAAPED